MTEELIAQLKNLEQNLPLKSKTTMRVGGEARFFYRAEKISQLVKAVKIARSLKIPHLILGGGSNIIISDQGYPGLVIENRTSQMEIQNGQVATDSGVFLDLLIRNLAEQDRGGLEFLAGIPGTVGGAVINNAGSFGWQIGNRLVNCLIFDQAGQEKVVSPAELDLDYRKSSLKAQTEGEEFPVILRAVFKVGESSSEAVMRKINDYRRIRDKSQPQQFSAGCIFCNPKIKGDFPGEWRDKIKDGRISAGFLLDMAGAKKLREGRARVSSEHANFIINPSRAKAGQVKKLADKMKKLVKDKYGISLIREVEFIGDFD
jgi:UDP-N-acetylmuramate dehydrogenase